jgi:hypothetical protein
LKGEKSQPEIKAKNKKGFTSITHLRKSDKRQKRTTKAVRRLG